MPRLEANNTTAFSGAVTGTKMTRLSWDGDNGKMDWDLYLCIPRAMT